MKTKEDFLAALCDPRNTSLSLDSDEDRKRLAGFLAMRQATDDQRATPYRAGNTRGDVRSILGALAYCHESAAYWLSCDEHAKAQEYLETAERHVKALVRLNETL